MLPPKVEMAAFYASAERLNSMRSALLDMVNTYPIEFHPSTLPTFECVRTCGGCCTNGYFFEEEFQRLPKKYHYGLFDSGVHAHQLAHSEKYPEKCIFYTAKGCKIHKYSPMRCRIFPYLPVVDLGRKKIFILSESFSCWPDLTAPRKSNSMSTLCPGHVTNKRIDGLSFLDMVRIFLRKSMEEDTSFSSLAYIFFQDIEFLVEPHDIAVFLACLSKKGRIPYPDRGGKWR